MTTFIAHYRSPNASAQRALGLFEFESDARIGTKANQRDARMRMLELYGAAAVGWNIDKIERKSAKKPVADGQLELDFRDPIPERKRKRSKGYW